MNPPAATVEKNKQSEIMPARCFLERPYSEDKIKNKKIIMGIQGM